LCSKFAFERGFVFGLHFGGDSLIANEVVGGPGGGRI